MHNLIFPIYRRHNIVQWFIKKHHRDDNDVVLGYGHHHINIL